MFSSSSNHYDSSFTESLLRLASCMSFSADTSVDSCLTADSMSGCFCLYIFPSLFLTRYCPQVFPLCLSSLHIYVYSICLQQQFSYVYLGLSSSLYLSRACLLLLLRWGKKKNLFMWYKNTVYFHLGMFNNAVACKSVFTSFRFARDLARLQLLYCIFPPSPLLPSTYFL